jgi:hypothetical protein
MGAIHILLDGSDTGLLALRGRVLESAGYVVHVSTRFEHSQEILNTTSVDMCILCQSLTYEESLQFLVFASRVSPNMKMLRLSPDDLPDNVSGGRESIEVLNTFVWPSLLIETVGKITGTLARQHAHATNSEVR